MAQISVEMTGDEAKLWQSFQKVVAQQQKVENSLKDTTRAGKKLGDEATRAGKKMQRAGQQGKQAFGGSAVAGLKTYVAGIVSIGGALAGITKAWGKVSEASREAANVARGAAVGAGPLAQLAYNDPALYKTLQTRGRQLYAAGGAESLQEALQTTFELQSAGGLDEWRLAARAYGQTDVRGLFKAGGKIRSAMGVQEAGTFRQLLGKGLAAAAPIAGESASSMLLAATDPAAGAGQLGLTDEELMAATSLAGEVAKQGATGGAQVKTLFGALVKQGYAGRMKGKPLGAMLRDVQAKGMTEAELTTFLGGTESLAAYTALTKPGAWQARLADIQGAQAGGAEKMFGVAEADPLQVSLRRSRKAKALADLSGLGLGQQTMDLDTYQKLMFAAGRAEGESALRTNARDIGMNITRWVYEPFLGPERVQGMMQLGVNAGIYPDPLSAGPAIEAELGLEAPTSEPGGRRGIPEFFQALDRATNKLKDTADRMRGGATLGKPDIDR